jgi:hypothetical protein
MDEGENLPITRPTGVSKIHVATAFGNQAYLLGKRFLILVQRNYITTSGCEESITRIGDK